MNDKQLRSKLIRLAYEKPELRSEILPLVTSRTAASEVDALVGRLEKFFDRSLQYDLKKVLAHLIKTLGPEPDKKAIENYFLKIWGDLKLREKANKWLIAQVFTRNPKAQYLLRTGLEESKDPTMSEMRGPRGRY